MDVLDVNDRGHSVYLFRDIQEPFLAVIATRGPRVHEHKRSVVFAVVVCEPIDFTLAHKPYAVKNGLFHEISHPGHGVRMRDGASPGEDPLEILFKSNAGVKAD